MSINKIDTMHYFDSKDMCLHRLFEGMVRLFPYKTAVSYEEKIVTYTELNHQANQLANYLKKKIVQGDVIAIIADRSINMIIFMLGVLKAGACYLPIDPNYPIERIRYLLQDSQAKIVIVDSDVPFHSILPAFFKSDCLLWYRQEKKKIKKEPKDNLYCLSNGESLAYIMYTSGTTGYPKGVKVSHHNVVRLFSSTDLLFEFSSNDVWSCFHSYSFDFSTWEIYGALLHGARLVIIPYAITRKSDAFYKLIFKKKVTVLSQTPLAFQNLVSIIEKKSRLSLRYVIFGGDTLNKAALASWWSFYEENKPILVNMYGVTEATVHATFYELTRSDLDSEHDKIGLPLKDTRLYLLNHKLKPVKQGKIGEIYIAGEGVAQGYFNNDKLTKKNFVFSLFIKNEILYRTGDFGYQLNDGSFAYVGRKDKQIKFFGYRIELAEIEFAISQNPCVEKAVVLLDKSTVPHNLVAFIKLNNESPKVEIDFLPHLKNLLPAFMLPTEFCFITRFPLTAHGKIDNDELLNLYKGKVMLEPAYDSEEEIILSEIWLSILGSKPAATDNFFDCGGNTTLAQKLVDKVNNYFNTDLQKQEIIENPSFYKITRRIKLHRL